jgi:hypothetical protein
MIGFKVNYKPGLQFAVNVEKFCKLQPVNMNALLLYGGYFSSALLLLQMYTLLVMYGNYSGYNGIKIVLILLFT